jgi:hypothetical protein
MYGRVLIVCLITILTVSCAKNGAVPAVIDTACDWVRPIYLTEQDIRTLDRQTKRDIATHNNVWERNCSPSTH